MTKYRICIAPIVALLFPLAPACNGGAERTDPPDWVPLSDATEQFEVTLARPGTSNTLNSADLEIDNSPVGIACATCHAEGEGPAFAAHLGKERNFHSTIVMAHGTLSCANCHVMASPDKLHSSAGETFPMSESRTLCSQCHGLIRKAYDHGAHGGMRGYWDLSRGPRERNDCITCHSPHAPAYPKVMPVPGPKDRNVFKKQHPGSIIDMRFGGESHE